MRRTNSSPPPRQQTFESPVYRRPSRRGGAAGVRELSVSRIFRAAGYRRRAQFVPYIRMSGRWLQRLGFSYGDRIEVAEERGRIVLSIAKADDPFSVN